MALFVLTAVSVTCVALLFIEHQDIDLLQQHVAGLRQENTELRSQLNDYRNGLLTPQKSTARSSD